MAIDCGLSIGVMENTKINEAQAAADTAAPVAAATKNTAAAAATPNAPSAADKVDVTTEADTSNAPATETYQLRCRFT